MFFVDTLLLFLAYCFSQAVWYWVTKQTYELWDNDSLQYFFSIFIAFCGARVFTGPKKSLVLRGRFEEFFQNVKVNFYILLFATLIAFVFRMGAQFSRAVLAITICVNVLMTYVVHIFLKLFLLKRRNQSLATRHVMLITTEGRLHEVLLRAEKYCDWHQRITSIALVDGEESCIGTKVKGITIVATHQGIIDAARQRIVDEVFLFVPYRAGLSTKQYVEDFEQMGVDVHLYLEVMQNFEGANHVLSSFAGYPVITFSQKFFSWYQLAIKRLMDILGGLVGMVFVLIAILLFGIPLKLESKGPLFFKQKRVGKNGRFFTIYKFRSMYMDAEERKKELMAQNEMQGAMFKMTNDPRITKVGKFLRATSIDELPQFFNVLKGDMSLVGTRPPTIEEFNEYSPYHKRRLCLKPGLSGMWQVSGRSDITDFEEVVKLDLQYIDNWSLGLDVKIIIKTFFVVFGRKGSK